MTENARIIREVLDEVWERGIRSLDVRAAYAGLAALAPEQKGE